MSTTPESPLTDAQRAALHLATELATALVMQVYPFMDMYPADGPTIVLNGTAMFLAALMRMSGEGPPSMAEKELQVLDVVYQSARRRLLDVEGRKPIERILEKGHELYQRSLAQIAGTATPTPPSPPPAHPGGPSLRARPRLRRCRGGR